MAEDLVSLSEDENTFNVDGNSSVSFFKLSGLVTMHYPILGAIPKEKIFGLFIDEDELRGSGLYLGWRRGNLTEHTYLGKIDDINSANDFVSRVNRLYKK